MSSCSAKSLFFVSDDGSYNEKYLKIKIWDWLIHSLLSILHFRNFGNTDEK